MGLFLAVSSIVGKTKDEVENSLRNYAKSVNGDLQKCNNINLDMLEYYLLVGIPNCCIIEEANGNASIFYPAGYTEWDNSSEFISKELSATVFSFHIHDHALWMYIMYNNGKIVDQFNPIPDIWDDSLSDEEIDSWKGNAQIIAKYIPSIIVSDIDRYLMRWDFETSEKAYPTDEFAQEDWQMTDFMEKLKLPYPGDADGIHRGQTYKYWTDNLKLENDQKYKDHAHELKLENDPDNKTKPKKLIDVLKNIFR